MFRYPGCFGQDSTQGKYPRGFFCSFPWAGGRNLLVIAAESFIIRSMAQAIMNPEEVRRFAQELKRFNTDVQQRASSLQSRFAALGETWQDQEHEKFAGEFVSTMKAIKKFMELSEQHTPFLLRKAQRIEDYLNQR